jgi:uncharacterized protein YprB with RNaseH-like and TPR domain
MEMPQSHSLVVLSAERATRLAEDEIEDLIEYFDPDGVLLISDGAARYTVEQMEWELDQFLGPECTVHSLTRADARAEAVDSGTLLFTPDEPSSETVAELAGAPGGHTYVLTNSVSVSMDMMDLTATVEGLAPYRGHEAPLTVFSAGLEADYWVEHDGITVRGLAPIEGQTVKIPCITFGAAGVATTRELPEGKLGIRALSGMGATYAERFKTAGYRSVEDVHEAEMTDLLEIKGVGEYRAEKFEKQARALIEGEIVRFTDDGSLPKDVVHIDIETDGLSPTIIWQIGLYDPRADEFTTFLQKNPEQKGDIIREFGAWLRSNLDGRAIVAYNGWKFDFPHLESFFHRYAPEYADLWTRSYRVDPYDWAVREGNVSFPSRGNKLEDVAEALGYEREETGLDGATTGNAYQRWMQNPCDKTELDWDRHTAYCREDVMALAHIYEAIQNSGRLLAEQNTDRPTDENTSQGTLFDY